MADLSGFRGLRVLLTGHTGFKGGWLTAWLHRLGAEVHGLSLDPIGKPNLFEVGNIAALLANDLRVDLRDASAVNQAVQQTKPDIVMHLAAQAIVKEGYVDPLGTFGTNVMGTANLLNALRQGPAKAIVVVTTDKVYENREWVHAYREDDRLGGRDPYSASKACTEMVARAFRDSYPGELPSIATARAGNVIGGGDWSADRLLPDCMRAFANGEVMRLRNPGSTRPWQHVLDPLAGYLMLAKALMHGEKNTADAWNFGPERTTGDSAAAVVRLAAKSWGGDPRVEVATQTDAPHEAGALRLTSDKARQLLGWAPHWELERAIDETVSWHRAYLENADMMQVIQRQISAWEECA